MPFITLNAPRLPLQPASNVLPRSSQGWSTDHIFHKWDSLGHRPCFMGVGTWPDLCTIQANLTSDERTCVGSRFPKKTCRGSQIFSRHLPPSTKRHVFACYSPPETRRPALACRLSTYKMCPVFFVWTLELMSLLHELSIKRHWRLIVWFTCKPPFARWTSGRG